VAARAVTSAQRSLDLVLARSEGLLLRGGGVELERNEVGANGLTLVELATAEREASRGNDDNVRATGRGVRRHGVVEVDIEVGAGGTLLGENPRAVGERTAVVVVRADATLLADPDRVGISISDELDELLNADSRRSNRSRPARSCQANSGRAPHTSQ